MSKASKSLATGLAATAGYKFIAKANTTRAVVLGSITGGSVYFTDVVLGFIPSLPSMFSFLGTNAMDGVSSLIAAVLTSLFLTYKAEEELFHAFTDIKALAIAFLYALGSTVAGSYLTPVVSRVTGL